LAGRTQRLLQNGGEPARLVAGRRVVVHVHPGAGGIILPPLDDADELLADFARRGAAGEQVLGAVDLRRLGEDRRAAMLDQQVDGLAQRRVGGDAGIAVRAAALQRQHQFRGRHGLAHGAVGDRQHDLERLDAGRDRLLGAAGLLDRQRAEDVALLDAIGVLHPLDLEAFAAETDDEDRRHVRVAGIAPGGALQDIDNSSPL
jgi:hypothetical protein